MGEHYLDISDWDKRFYDYSKNLICNFNIIAYDNEEECFKLSKEEPEIIKKLVVEPVNAHLHWLGLGTGVEIFIKSVLLKYKILPIKNRKITSKHPKSNRFSSREEANKYFGDDIAMVYRCCSWKVI